MTRATTWPAGVAAAVVAAVLSAGCTGGDGDRPPPNEGRRAASQPCDGLLRPADREAALPSNIPALEDATYYEIHSQGATKRYTAHAKGTDLVAVRDLLRSRFERAGFEVLSSDEEAGAEAEFQWEGRQREGSVQVTPLCQGHLKVRWRVGPQ